MSGRWTGRRRFTSGTATDWRFLPTAAGSCPCLRIRPRVSSCCRRDPVSRDRWRTAVSRPPTSPVSFPTANDSVPKAGTPGRVRGTSSSRISTAAIRTPRPVPETSMPVCRRVLPTDASSRPRDRTGKSRSTPSIGGAPRPLSGRRGRRERDPVGLRRMIALSNRTSATPARVFKIDIATGRRELWKTFAPSDRSGFDRHRQHRHGSRRAQLRLQLHANPHQPGIGGRAGVSLSPAGSASGTVRDLAADIVRHSGSVVVSAYVGSLSLSIGWLADEQRRAKSQPPSLLPRLSPRR